MEIGQAPALVCYPFGQKKEKQTRKPPTSIPEKKGRTIGGRFSHWVETGRGKKKANKKKNPEVKKKHPPDSRRINNPWNELTVRRKETTKNKGSP